MYIQLYIYIMYYDMDILTYGLFSAFNGYVWGYTALGSGRKKSLTKDSDRLR